MADEWDGPLPPHVTTPLLTRITEQSMDEDYQQVARARAASAARPRVPGARGWWPRP